MKKPSAPNPKFASEVAARVCELRNRDTSCLEGSDSVWAAMSYRSKQPSHDLGRSALHAGVHHAHFMDGEGKRLIPCERAQLLSCFGRASSHPIGASLPSVSACPRFCALRHIQASSLIVGSVHIVTHPQAPQPRQAERHACDLRSHVPYERQQGRSGHQCGLWVEQSGGTVHICSAGCYC